MIKVFLTTFILFIFAQISITVPGFEVPITMQTVAVTALPIIWRKHAFYGVILYLILGALGLPIFSELSGGFDVFLGKSGGFLIGFALAAWVIGSFFTPSNAWVKQLILMLLGHTIIITCGLVFIKLLIAPNYSVLDFMQKFGPAIGLKLLFGLAIIKLNSKILTQFYSNK